MKMNGKKMIPPVFILTLLVTGLIGYGELKSKVNDNAGEVVKLEKVHNEDIKSIDKKLATMLDLVHKGAVIQGKIQTNIQYIQRDIEEMKNR